MWRGCQRFWNVGKSWGIGVGFDPFSFQLGFSFDQEWWLWMHLPFCWAYVYREEREQEELGPGTYRPWGEVRTEIYLRIIEEMSDAEKFEIVSKISETIGEEQGNE